MLQQILFCYYGEDQSSRALNHDCAVLYDIHCSHCLADLQIYSNEFIRLLSGVRLAVLGTGNKSILLSGIVFLFCSSAVAEAEIISNINEVRLSGTALANLLKIQEI